MLKKEQSSIVTLLCCSGLDDNGQAIATASRMDVEAMRLSVVLTYPVDFLEYLKLQFPIDFERFVLVFQFCRT